MNKMELKKAGKSIMAEAKKIQKKYPKKSWRDCVSMAGKKYKA